VRNSQIVILDQVRFATGSAVILPASDPVLQAVLKILTDHPEIKKLSVEGHTDDVGPAAYNKQLSAARAASVVSWLVQHGISRDRLGSAGFGMERPLVPNDSEPHRQQNRRVEFHITDPAPSASP
jgi:OOP family OmpA-OmpF porin